MHGSVVPALDDQDYLRSIGRSTASCRLATSQAVSSVQSRILTYIREAIIPVFGNAENLLSSFKGSPCACNGSYNQIKSRLGYVFSEPFLPF